MKLSTIKKFLPVVPTGLLLAVLFLDLLAFISKSVMETVLNIRELLIAVAFLLLLPGFKKSKWVVDKNLANKIKGLFVCVIGVYLSFFIPNLFFFPRLNLDKESFHPVFSSLNTLLYATISSILVTIFGMFILLLLRDLIYAKRKRTTHRSFRLAIYVMLIQLAYFNWQKPEEGFLMDLEGVGIPGKILLFLLITLIVINSFHTFWVNYLNKRQKLACFVGGLLLLPATVMLTTLSQHKIISYYSVTMGIFLRQVGLFLSIYWAMALVSILLHLPTAGIYDRKMREVASLHQLSRVISSEFDPDKLVVLITRQSSEVIEANAVWLEVLDPPTGRLRLASSNNLREPELKAISSHSESGISEWILKNKLSVLINEVSKDNRTKYFKKINRNIGSLLGVPLVSYDKILGILYAVKFDEYGFGLDEQNMLQAFADQAAVALENARLVKESIVKERLEQELKVAHDAQMKLLPKTMPRLEGLDIDAICVTANEVGGDYYDFFLLDENRLAVVIGDVSGKGPEAAFYMAEVKGIMESLCRTYASPKELLIKTNEILYGRIDRKTFITLIYSVMDRNQRKLTFSRAGHCPLIYCPSGNGKAQFVEPRGLGVGLEKGKLFSQIIEEKSLSLHAGDTILFYTDGVVEARNSQQEEFGEQHFLEVTAQLARLNCSEIKNKIVEAIRVFSGPARPHDDLTMVVVKLI